MDTVNYLAKCKTIYKGKTIGLEVEPVRIKGRLAKVEKIIENNFVVVLPLSDDNTLLLERQYRPTLGKYIYELPAGHIDKGEAPRQTAIREMREETGFTPKRLQLMFSAYPMPGRSSQMSFSFLATGLYKGKIKLPMGPDEMIELKKVGIAKALQMIKSNQIKDTKTIAAILYYKSLCSTGKKK